MSYLVFARKFRPQLFEEVVGQEHVTTTLKNAIQKKRIAQSFLFSGSRGVGKTSTARILAKALNCDKSTDENPCNQCTTCDEIARGISLDVLEIDGASNRGIDEIRTLRENVKFKPVHGRFKVYIIDEVHMLTGEAFNALLKTLEEPPEHVKFIFATTEPHKVPLTILSRCQRFHFKRLSTADIHAKLKEIAKKEKIKVNDKTLFLIAKSAEGSLRDGEGLLDQLASFSGEEVREEDVLFSLGLTSNDTYLKFLQAISDRQGDKILDLVQSLVEQGKDLEQFLKGILERFRDLLVLTLGETKENWVEQDEETAAELKILAKKFNREELFLILSLLQQTLRDIRWSRIPRFSVEICLLKIVHRADLKSISDILTQLKNSPGEIPGPRKPFNPAALPAAVSEDKKKDLRVQEVIKHIPESESHVPAEIRRETKKNLSRAESVEESPVAVAEEFSQAKAISLADIERIWPELLTQVKAKRMSIGMFLSESQPVEVDGHRAIFGFPAEFKFHKETIEQQHNKSFVRDILKNILQMPVDVSFVVTEAEQMTEKAPAEQAPGVDSGVISSALEIFDGSKVIRKT